MSDFTEPEIVYVEKRELERLRQIETAARALGHGGSDYTPGCHTCEAIGRELATTPVSDDTEGAG